MEEIEYLKENIKELLKMYTDKDILYLIYSLLDKGKRVD